MLRDLAKLAKGGEQDARWTVEDALVIIEEKLDNSVKEEDHGLEMLSNVLKSIETLQAPKVELVQQDQSVKGLKFESWRKDFKLSGQIGDHPSSIGYMSFLRQIGMAKEKGYKDPEIIDGVIRAISPTAKIRGYLEGRERLTLPTVSNIIRCFYREKTATELYQELCTLTQGIKETTQEFMFRALELRQKIVFASKEDVTLSYDPKLVEQQFRHTVSTGLRDDAIRAELQTVLAKYDTDETLLHTVNEITKRHQERQTKIGGPSGPIRAKVQSVTQEDIIKELKALRVEVSEMRQKRYGAESGETNRPRNQPRGRKCIACRESQQPRCNHCYGCGSAEHYRRDCPEN